MGKHAQKHNRKKTIFFFLFLVKIIFALVVWKFSLKYFCFEVDSRENEFTSIARNILHVPSGDQNLISYFFLITYKINQRISNETTLNI